jgi:hypothetical protein
MNPYSKHSHCTNCFKKYHHDVMIQTKNSVDHYCLKCFNLKENENEKEKTNTLQSNDYSEDQKVAREAL